MYYQEELNAVIRDKSIPDHGIPFTEGIEQIGANETAHFTSEAFKETFGFGMEAFADTFPYGWSSLAEYWTKEHPEYAPTGIVAMGENSSALQSSRGVRRFIKFPSVEASWMSVAKEIEIKGRFGAWFNNKESDEDTYEVVLNSIVPRLTRAIVSEDGTK